MSRRSISKTIFCLKTKKLKITSKTDTFMTKREISNQTFKSKKKNKVSHIWENSKTKKDMEKELYITKKETYILEIGLMETLTVKGFIFTPWVTGTKGSYEILLKKVKENITMRMVTLMMASG